MLVTDSVNWMDRFNSPLKTPSVKTQHLTKISRLHELEKKPIKLKRVTQNFLSKGLLEVN